MNVADRVLHCIGLWGEASIDDITESLGIPKRTAFKVIDLLQSAGRIGLATSGPPPRWALTDPPEQNGQTGHPKPEPCNAFDFKTEGQNQGLGFGLRVKGSSPLPPKTERPWRKSDVIGRDGVAMWIDPDGYHVSVRSMAAELRSRLGINAAVALPKETPQEEPTANDPFLTGEDAAQRVRALIAQIKAAKRRLP